MTAEIKKSIIEQYATHEGDTGSPEVQIAILTYRINNLTEHLKSNNKDHPQPPRTSQDGRSPEEISSITS